MAGLLILFPGQGSQAVGMAEYLWDFPAARAIFAEATEALGWDLGDLCRHGSMAELTRTDRAQPALLTCSVAVWKLLEEEGVSFSVAAGHSLGEYSALVATGHLSFVDALRVVEQRGLAMQACAEFRPGTMAAVIGLEDETVEEICSSLPDVWLANYNSPGQLVISGSVGSVREAGEMALTRGAKRVVPLSVSGAFHTTLMAGAAERLSEALAGVSFEAYCNTAGLAHAGPCGRFFSTTESRFPDPGELADVLARQLTSPVKFTQSMTALLGGQNAPEWGLEVGPGNVLSGLMKRIARDFSMAGTGDSEALRKALETLSSRG